MFVFNCIPSILRFKAAGFFFQILSGSKSFSVEKLSLHGLSSIDTNTTTKMHVSNHRQSLKNLLYLETFH